MYTPCLTETRQVGILLPYALSTGWAPLVSYALAVNAGSSSIKMRLYETRENESDSPINPLCFASIEDIGQEFSQFRSSVDMHNIDSESLPVYAGDHNQAVEIIVNWIRERYDLHQVTVLGHRIVHGAQRYTAPTRITNEVTQALKEMFDIDPDHMPAALDCLAALQTVFAQATHVACFDTAFYAELPRPAQIVPIPRKYEAQGVKRYGFHGISYQYLLQDFREYAGSVAARGRIIIAHLGSGASMVAIHNAKPVDMTMGFSPASGIPMSSRSGDLDPSILAYLHRKNGMDITEFTRMVHSESGLLGISDSTPDMRILLQEQSSDPQAAEAVTYFTYQARKAIGSLSTTIGGIDSLIFSGGIGIRSAEIRQRICEDLQYLGIELDSNRNAQHERLISSDTSSVGVHVIPTDEEFMIAQQALHKAKEGTQ